MHTPPCIIELNTFKICMRECVKITYTTFFLGCLFRFCYQNQVIKLMRPWKSRILLPDWFNLVNEPWYTAKKTPLYQNKVFLTWCQTCDVISAVHYCTGVNVQITIPLNIIIDMVSSNRCQLYGKLFYTNGHWHFEHKNIFVGMVMGSKNKS